MKLAFIPSFGQAPLESRSVLAVEKILRKVRAFAYLVVGNRIEADEIVEDALTLYLATDPEPEAADEAYAYMVAAIRRLIRTSGARSRRSTDLDAALAPLLQLPLEIREVAALHLGAGLSVRETAGMLGQTMGETSVMLGTVRQAIGAETYDLSAPSGD